MWYHSQLFIPRTTDAQWSLFSLKSRAFGLGQTNWADKFWGIWGIFGQTIRTHFGTVCPLSMFSIIQPLFLQKNKLLNPHLKYLFGIRDLTFVCPQSVFHTIKQCFYQESHPTKNVVLHSVMVNKYANNDITYYSSIVYYHKTFH